ncbi:unnamed protein product, partial [Didymodactylos carnosus]
PEQQEQQQIKNGNGDSTAMLLTATPLTCTTTISNTLSSSPTKLSQISLPSNPNKIPMQINTDTQKALEHLRELASNPSALERIQTLANNPNFIQEIKKIANQSFIDQLRTLPPFTPANLQQQQNEQQNIRITSESEQYNTVETTPYVEQQQEQNSVMDSNLMSSDIVLQSKHFNNLYPLPVGNDEFDSSTLYQPIMTTSGPSILAQDPSCHLNVAVDDTAYFPSTNDQNPVPRCSCEDGHHHHIQTFSPPSPTVSQQHYLQPQLFQQQISPNQQNYHHPILDCADLELASVTSKMEQLQQHCCGECPPSSELTTQPPQPPPTSSTSLRLGNRIDVDCETESNHDTALTLACAGGHEELVLLLLQRGANIEHRDKKGFTPLILAATAGHSSIVAILLDNGANIEAQSERTKDTALSLACSGGRQDVVEVLLKKAANREHRNVSDYTPLSLAASGGYVNIIKLLLSYGAEINSRTGSKLGISPLMLASMNGHVAAVKLLLDMGSDINAQIETNRNTALTLACFQGRAEVVSLLVDRKANIEHRAKTGLTPLMESASGGYVDVGRVLLERGADVNAPPVPTSKDTALTIAADKGHNKFVELLLLYGATIDVRNKKGATPLWLACNGGHLEVVQLLVSRFANPDSEDSRKVSCLMAAFRKGHIKVVKYMVKQVRQFPSDADCRRLITTITDKDLLKKCQNCMDQIITAKERQAQEANKAANNLLKEIDLEKSREECRKLAAAKKREKRKMKKKEKQQPPVATTTAINAMTNDVVTPAQETDNTIELKQQKDDITSSSLMVDDDLRIKMKMTAVENITSSPVLTTVISQLSPIVEQSSKKKRILTQSSSGLSSTVEQTPEVSTSATMVAANNDNNKKKKKALPNNLSLSRKFERLAFTKEKSLVVNNNPQPIINEQVPQSVPKQQSTKQKQQKSTELSAPIAAPTEQIDSVESTSTTVESMTPFLPNPLVNVKLQIDATKQTLKSQQTMQILTSTTNTTTTPTITMGEDGWQEVIGKQKKVTIPHEQYSRVIGRSGCNLNVLREVTGASIDVENKRAVGDKIIVVKGNGDSIKHAYQLIMALLKNSESELMSLLPNTAKTTRGNTSSANTTNSNTTIASTTDSSSLITDNSHDLNISTNKTQRARTTSLAVNTNVGPRFQNNSSTESNLITNSTTLITTTKSVTTAPTSTKSSKTTSSRSTSSSSKAPSAIGATWINSNRSNRANRGENAITSSGSAWNTTNASKSSSSVSSHFPASKSSFNSSGNTSTSSMPSSAVPTSSYYYNYSNSYHNQPYHYSNTKQYSSSSTTTNSNKIYPGQQQQKEVPSTSSSSLSSSSSSEHCYSTNSASLPTATTIVSTMTTASMKTVASEPAQPGLTTSYRLQVTSQPASVDISATPLLAISTTTSTPTTPINTLTQIPKSPGDYNPFGTNILTTVVDAFTRKELRSNNNDQDKTAGIVSNVPKMNFANAAKMGVITTTAQSSQSKQTITNLSLTSKQQQQQNEQVTINVDVIDPPSPPPPDPKIAPGYRPPSTNTTPSHQHIQSLTASINSHIGDSISPTISRAPGSNRGLHSQQVSPSINSIKPTSIDDRSYHPHLQVQQPHILTVNGGSCIANLSSSSSTSSSPSSTKTGSNDPTVLVANNQIPSYPIVLPSHIQQQQQSNIFTSLDNNNNQHKSFGPIGSQRPPEMPSVLNENLLKLAATCEQPRQTKLYRTSSANNNPPQSFSNMMNYTQNNLSSRSRSSLNPNAPDFRTRPMGSYPNKFQSNEPMSVNIMSIAKMVEERQKLLQQQQQQNGTPSPTTIHQYVPSQPFITAPTGTFVQPVIAPPLGQHLDSESTAAIQQQLQNFYRIQQQQQQQTITSQPPQLPPQSQWSPSLFQIANTLAANGQLPADTNTAAALVVAYYYSNYLSRTNQNINMYDTQQQQQQQHMPMMNDTLNKTDAINATYHSQDVNFRPSADPTITDSTTAAFKIYAANGGSQNLYSVPPSSSSMNGLSDNNNLIVISSNANSTNVTPTKNMQQSSSITSSSSSASSHTASTSGSGDNNSKIVPAAIGSERKRTTNVMDAKRPTTSIGGSGDWSTKLDIDPNVHQASASFNSNKSVSSSSSSTSSNYITNNIEHSPYMSHNGQSTKEYQRDYNQR